MAKKEVAVDLTGEFQQFLEDKGIDQATTITVLEESFRSVIAKMFGSDENFDVIVNPNKGDCEIYKNLVVVPDGEVQDPNKEIALSDALKEGHAQGNAATGKTTGEPNAVVKGRSVNGTIAKPAYSVQDAGIVVVSIWVDQYGTVQKAQPGAPGTTVNNSTLWAAARKAALETHFNMDGSAPPLQQGTITYVFELKK